MMKIENWKKNPRDSGPPHPPTMRVIHPQQRWNTHGEQQSWFQILPPDGAQEENILAINIQHSNKKGKYRKRINRSSTSHPNTPTHIHAKSFKTHYKFIAIYEIQQKRNFISMSCSRKDRMTGKQLYEASHIYLMIAIIRENIQENHHLKTSLIVKTTSHLNTH